MSMIWQQDWQRIVARINGLHAAIQVTIDSGQQHYLGANGYFHEQWNRIFQEIARLFAIHASSVPQQALARFDEFRQKHAAIIDLKEANYAPSRLAYLVGLRAELDYLLFDNEIRIRRAAERAFIHLQRLIVADEDVQRKWQSAFRAGEEACERLGAAHLIHHSLWAFKANATAGGRTDLILDGPTLDEETARKALDGIVLTEWKHVDNPSEATGKAQQAIAQCKSYSSGMLAGFELTSVRYIVLVSEKQLPKFLDVDAQDVTYRHINIPVNPDQPSIAARKAKN